MVIDAYLDIETTGLSWLDSGITVIGIYRVNGKEDRTVQLVGKDITVDNLLEVVNGVNTLYTYNGRRFDHPLLTARRVDETVAEHHDLMYDCWQCNLFGGFKEASSNWALSFRASLGWMRSCSAEIPEPW